MKPELQKSINVLVVDDEKIMQASCCRVLEKEGYTVSSADSGEAALEQCDRKSFDLVLLDLKMPGMGGIEITQRIKRQYDWIKIIILTSKNQESDEFWGMKQGADAYMTKPFDGSELLAKAVSLL